MKDALKKLDKLTNEKARMASAQVLQNTHVISDNLAAVDTQVKAINNNVDVVKRSSSVPSSLNVERLT